MSKAHRGTGIRKEPNHGRGICGRCGKSQIKTLYDQEVDGKKVKICKICNIMLRLDMSFLLKFLFDNNIKYHIQNKIFHK